MENVLERFEKVKACVFDVDGVMTDGSVHVTTDGQQLRTFYIKDGLAMVKAKEAGLPIAVISAGNNEGVRKRLEYLGVEFIFLGVKNKLQKLQELLDEYKITFDDVLYMGDDLPDLKILQTVGFPTCPNDAVSEVLNASVYVSPKDGGRGAVRDVIEKTMKAQQLWKV